MTITVQYSAQARAAAGAAEQQVALDGPASLADLLARLARQNPRLAPILVGADGRPRPSLLLFLGDRQVRADSDVALRDGDVLAILTPIAGG